MFEAHCWYRDADGRTRRVTARGRSSSAAINRLRDAVARRRHSSGVTLSGGWKVSEAADLWLAKRLEQVEAGDMATRSLEPYESALKLHVLPALGEVRLREATTATCEVWLIEPRKRVGPSTCRTARAVLSGSSGTRRGWTPSTNPVRGLSPIAGKRTRQPRAMTREERDGWLAWMDTHAAVDPRKPARAPRSRPPRASSSPPAPWATSPASCSAPAAALARRWPSFGTRSSLPGRSRSAGTSCACAGRGSCGCRARSPDAGDRVLRLPTWCRDMPWNRRTDPRSGYPVFPDVLGGWRDPNLVMRWMRWSRNATGYGWVQSHVFRQTVISMLDEAGLSTREVADHAGHSQIAQTQQYMARKIVSERAAEALEGLL